MADPIVSAVAGRLIGLIEEQARYHINLVRGAEEKIRSLAVDLRQIRNVLNDAENRRFKEDGVNYWLSRLEQTAYEMEDVLDEWDYALLKFQIEEPGSEAVVAPPKQKVYSFVPSSSCLCFKKVAVRHNIGKKILSVKAKLDEILKERNKYDFVVSQPIVDPSPASWRDQSTSQLDLTKVHGRDRDRDDLVAKLMDNGGSQEESGFRVLSIVGTGGLGKTTLAQMVYNHSRVVESFDLRIWVCVSDPFNLCSIVKGILESIKVGSSPSTNHLDVLLKQLKECISGRKFLLVLDDVWTEDPDKWEPLKNSLRCGGAGSRILVTSRSERVVKMMGLKESEICHPRVLSDEDCWLLLCRMALSGRNEVEFGDIGKEIAKKCKGLPLAAKTMGSLLLFKSSIEQWSNVLNSEIWQMEEAEIAIFPHLLLSYNALSPMLKRCFSYCAVFSKDTQIDVESLIQDWMALGYLGSNVADMELKGREYFDALAMRSMFQDFVRVSDSGEIKKCKMHDIIHDFAQFLKKKGRVEVTGMRKGKICQVCDPSHISTVNEFCSLYCENETFPSICDCLVRVRIFILEEMKSIPQGMESLIHLRRLSLFSIINLSREDLKVIFKLYHLQGLRLCGCNIEEIPKEIGNLIHLNFLDLSNNRLKELPMEIRKLIHLRHLDVGYNASLKELSEGICVLEELQTLNIKECRSLYKIPDSLVHKVSEIPVGIGGNKLELLKNSMHVCGVLRLKMRLDGDGDLNEVVEDARKAELKNMIHITDFELSFNDEMGEKGWSSLSWVWLDVLDALQPHRNLNKLEIEYYGGSKLSCWMVSPLNNLKNLSLRLCGNLTSLPLLGKLPCLEEISFIQMEAIEVVGREFLGITRGEGDVTVFPKLKTLVLLSCRKLKKWEDINVEEEECAAFSIMPCLAYLEIRFCYGLSMLPHRLLRKVTSLKKLDILGSRKLQKRYGNKEGSDWKSISTNNPALQLIILPW